MKRRVLVLAALLLMGCSTFQYKARYQEARVLLDESIALNDSAIVLMDSLTVELEKCQSTLQNINEQ